MHAAIVRANAAHVAKRNQSPFTLVPKCQSDAIETLQHRQPAHAVKFGVIA
jgi:hypothetical protein